ncbi:MAG: pyrroloquinoline quinone precursor peptide PqqA [Gammaproteobacteria bacterium]
MFSARVDRTLRSPIVAAWVTRLKRANLQPFGRVNMAWETPSYSDVRFGFEVTMYINNR